MLLYSEASARNQQPILDVLRKVLAHATQVLEIGSGTGQHAVHFAKALPYLEWQPSDRSEHLANLEQRVKLEGGVNLKPPLLLDVSQPRWPVTWADAIYTANTLHIMSWQNVEAAFRGINTVLAQGGTLCLYGPFRYAGRYTSDSNRDFDAMLQARDPESGLRDVDAIQQLALAAGLRLVADHDLPANNRLLEFTRFEKIEGDHA